MLRLKTALGFFESPYNKATPEPAAVIKHLTIAKPSPRELACVLTQAIAVGHWEVVDRFLPQLSPADQAGLVEGQLRRDRAVAASQLHDRGIRLAAPSRFLQECLWHVAVARNNGWPGSEDMDAVVWPFEDYPLDKLKPRALNDRVDVLLWVLFHRSSEQMLKQIMRFVPLGDLTGDQWCRLAQAQFFLRTPPHQMEGMTVGAVRLVATRNERMLAGLRAAVGTNLAGYVWAAV